MKNFSAKNLLPVSFQRMDDNPRQSQSSAFAAASLFIVVVASLLSGCRTSDARYRRETALLRAEILDLEDQLYAMKAQGVRSGNGQVVGASGDFPLETYYAPPFEDGVVDMGECCSQGDVIYEGDMSYGDGGFVDGQPYYEYDGSPMNGAPLVDEYYGDQMYDSYPIESYPADSYPIETAPMGVNSIYPEGAIVPPSEPLVSPPEIIETPEPTPAQGESESIIDNPLGQTLDRFRQPRRIPSNQTRTQVNDQRSNLDGEEIREDVFVDSIDDKTADSGFEPRYDRPQARNYQHNVAFADESGSSTFLPSQSSLEPVLASVTEIHINPALSHGADVDDKPGDDGIVLVVQPRSSDGQIVTHPGEMTISLIDPAANTLNQRVGIWEFSSSEIDLFEMGSGQREQGYLLHLPWDLNLPQHKRLIVFARYITADGRRLESSKEMIISPPPSDYSADDPVVEAWTRRDSRWLTAPSDAQPDSDDETRLVARGRQEENERSRSSDVERPSWRPVR